MASTASNINVGPTSGQSSFGTSIVGKNQDATCYVGNLEERATDSLIWELFLQVAPVVSIHIPRDRLNQTHFGYGFVELQSEADAEYASKILHGVKFYGRPLKVNKASADKKNLDVGANLFVGNLEAMVDDSMLMDTFKSFGTVLSAKVAREGEGGTGPSRGFGFVSFDSFDAADTAIESMSGQFLCNRPITVSYAFKKEGKGERHGGAAERLLAAQAKKGMASGGNSVQNGYRPGMPMMPQGIPQGVPQGYAQQAYPMPQAIPQAYPQQGYPMPQAMQGYPAPPQGYDPNYAAMMMMQQQQQLNPEYYAQYQQQYALYQQQLLQQQQFQNQKQ